MDPILGQIILFAGNFAPKGWLLCHGQVLPISQYQALFSLLGTTYGGNGTTTFALPDLRGRVPVGTGEGPGLNNRELGDFDGSENVTLLPTNLPYHTHDATANTTNNLAVTATAQLNAFSEPGNANAPSANLLADSGATDKEYRKTGTKVVMGSGAITVTPTLTGTINTTVQIKGVGNNMPFSIVQPVLGMNYIIAMEGIYPARP